MALILRTISRQALLKQPAFCLTNRMPMASSAYEEMRKYWEKNRQLERPLSPFIGVYKFHLSMTMSLAHRITGVAMTSALSGAAILMMCLPETYPYYLQMVKDLSLGPVILTSLKYILALPVTYHFLNGIRHLAWDAGYGFSTKVLYQSGYFVMALALLISSALVFCM